MALYYDDKYRYDTFRNKVIYSAIRIVWYIIGLIEALLAFRFILRLLGANPAAGFTSFIYGVTLPLVDPFLNVFRVNRIDGGVFEWTTLLAIAVYYFIGWIIAKLLLMGRDVPPSEAESKLRKEDR